MADPGPAPRSQSAAPHKVSHLLLRDPAPETDTPSAANEAARLEKNTRSMPSVMADADPENEVANDGSLLLTFSCSFRAINGY